jgi:acyl-CoA reductase-like NAD-dependent aldehyde dehydrogenase
MYEYTSPLSFSGVGVMVAKAAADNLTPVVLELGGKDPFVVCDDVKVST